VDLPLGQREGIGYLTLYLSDSADLEETLERALSAGATLVMPPAAHRPGARAALFRDPGGNIVELLEETLS
jgi:predicted enzyme related to lactoylglutathione lyase